MIVVTGGSGFIGSHLVERLSTRSAVKVIDVSPLPTRISANSRVTHTAIDVANIEPEHLQGARVVYHLAGNANGSRSVTDPVFDFDSNTRGTLKVLNAARLANVPTTIITSSAAVYGKPTTYPMTELHPTDPFIPYGASKLAGETVARAFHATYGLDVRIARPFCVYGPGEPHESSMVEVSRFARWHLLGETVKIVGNPNLKTRDFVYVADATSALEVIADNGSAGCAYNVGSGTEISMAELARLIGKVSGTDIEFEGSSVLDDTYRLVSDNSRLVRLGYSPQVSLAEGVDRVISDLRLGPIYRPGSDTIFSPGQVGESGPQLNESGHRFPVPPEGLL